MSAIAAVFQMLHSNGSVHYWALAVQFIPVVCSVEALSHSIMIWNIRILSVYSSWKGTYVPYRHCNTSNYLLFYKSVYHMDTVMLHTHPPSWYSNNIYACIMSYENRIKWMRTRVYSTASNLHERQCQWRGAAVWSCRVCVQTQQQRHVSHIGPSIISMRIWVRCGAMGVTQLQLFGDIPFFFSLKLRVMQLWQQPFTQFMHPILQFWYCNIY